MNRRRESSTLLRWWSFSRAVVPGFATGRWLPQGYSALQSVLLQQGGQVQAIPVDRHVRVRVPFGRQKLVGVVVELADRSELPEEKLRIVAESYDAGETVSAVARRYALSPQQLFAWRGIKSQGQLAQALRHFRVLRADPREVQLAPGLVEQSQVFW